MHLNDLMPRELALVKIWNDDNYFTSRSMDVYIAKIRKYLQKDNRLEIENIHGEGFRLIEKIIYILFLGWCFDIDSTKCFLLTCKYLSVVTMFS